jgi:hypothetical protein
VSKVLTRTVEPHYDEDESDMTLEDLLFALRFSRDFTYFKSLALKTLRIEFKTMQCNVLLPYICLTVSKYC